MATTNARFTEMSAVADFIEDGDAYRHMFCFVRFVTEFMGLAEMNCCETFSMCDYTVWHCDASCKVVLALAHKDVGL